MYTPILRNRQSEMLAFRGMPSDIRKQMIPLFDVAAPTKSAGQEKAVKYVNSNISRTEKIATGFEAVFADSSELNPSFRLPGNVHLRIPEILGKRFRNSSVRDSGDPRYLIPEFLGTQ
jgi:hypothetical protein